MKDKLRHLPPTPRFDLIVVSNLISSERVQVLRGGRGGRLFKSLGAWRFGEVRGSVFPFVEGTAFSMGFAFLVVFFKS